MSTPDDHDRSLPRKEKPVQCTESSPPSPFSPPPPSQPAPLPRTSRRPHPPSLPPTTPPPPPLRRGPRGHPVRRPVPLRRARGARRRDPARTPAPRCRDALGRGGERRRTLHRHIHPGRPRRTGRRQRRGAHRAHVRPGSAHQRRPGDGVDAVRLLRGRSAEPLRRGCLRDGARRRRVAGDGAVLDAPATAGVRTPPGRTATNRTGLLSRPRV